MLLLVVSDWKSDGGTTVPPILEKAVLKVDDGFDELSFVFDALTRFFRYCSADDGLHEHQLSQFLGAACGIAEFIGSDDVEYCVNGCCLCSDGVS